MQVTADNDSRYRKGSKVLNHFMLGIWRLGLGKYLNAWPEVSGRIMVLNHIGRKTGKRRQTPVNYAMVNGEIYCTAGFGASSDWYLNIIANPQVEVWLPEGWWAGVADEVVDPQLRLPLMREVIIASGSAAPAFGIKVQDLDNAALDELTRDYKLLRIRRTTARTGPGGPGDFAWIWPLTTLFLLLALMFRRRK
jgi:deazaflavin-dependent oxidoreductase (nitroreductase family)